MDDICGYNWGNYDENNINYIIFSCNDSNWIIYKINWERLSKSKNNKSKFLLEQ